MDDMILLVEDKEQAQHLIKEIEGKAKEEANKNAKEILSYAIQKCAADHTSETTVSIVTSGYSEKWY